MEVDDPIAAKFQTLIESLMVKTTTDIVKVFTEVLLETRVEISRSWREIDELKQHLQERKEQRTPAIFRSGVNCSLKKEDGGMSSVTPQVSISETSTIRPEDRGRKILENATVEKTDTRQSCVAVNGPATPQISHGTSLINLSVNRPNQNGAQLTQTVVRHKRGRKPKSSADTRCKSSMTKMVSKSPLQTVSIVSPPQTSSCTAMTILDKKLKGKKSVVVKKRCIKKKIASTCSISSTHKLRDRHLLGTQRRCTCCSLEQCALKKKHPKSKSQVVPHVYACKQCGKRFYEWMQLKHHKCIHKCNRCGQTFTSLNNMTTHRQSVNPYTRLYPYYCNLCSNVIATQCGWNMHKRIHANSDGSRNAQDTPKPSQTLTVPKELNAKVEVRLERISNAQLEAALTPKGSLLQDETTSLSSLDISPSLPSGLEASVFNWNATAPAKCTNMNTPVLTEKSTSQSVTHIVEECPPSTSSIGMDKNVKRTNIQTASAQIQPLEGGTESEPLTAQNKAGVECCEKGSSSKGANSSLRKQKMSDCNHGVYNGMFPVEKILGWRNTKGQNEVRVKWMPCTLCGAKWKNTWEPAESFISYKDSKNEESKNTNQKTNQKTCTHSSEFLYIVYFMILLTF